LGTKGTPDVKGSGDWPDQAGRDFDQKLEAILDKASEEDLVEWLVELKKIRGGAEMSDWEGYGSTCLRCNESITDAEYDVNKVAICDSCRPSYFQTENPPAISPPWITFENPVSLVDGVDQEEVEAICRLLRAERKDEERLSIQIDGYGEDIAPKKGFYTRFEATLKRVKEILALEDLKIDGYFSDSQAYTQPFTCWAFYIDRWGDD